jgi:hypothetical protein
MFASPASCCDSLHVCMCVSHYIVRLCFCVYLYLYACFECLHRRVYASVHRVTVVYVYASNTCLEENNAMRKFADGLHVHGLRMLLPARIKHTRASAYCKCYGHAPRVESCAHICAVQQTRSWNHLCHFLAALVRFSLGCIIF